MNDKRKVKPTKNDCENLIKDGAGTYCKLICMKDDKDYPHTHWRVFCNGNKSHSFCEGLKRGLLPNKDY